MRSLAWVLLIAGSVIATVTYLLRDAEYTELNWAASGAAFIGLVILVLSRKLTLDEDERLFYKSTAQGGDTGALKGDLGQSLKVAVTSKGIRYGGLFFLQKRARLSGFSLRHRRGKAGTTVSAHQRPQ